MDFGFTSIPSILVICYFIGMVVRISSLDSRYIPIICGVTGGALGVVAFFLVPEVVGSDPLMAIAIGISSGLAATGANQIGVQLNKKE